jgi:uridine kinase
MTMRCATTAATPHAAISLARHWQAREGWRHKVGRHGGLREIEEGQDMVHGTRDELLDRLAEAVGSVTVAHPTRVAIDGPPAAGKTTLADELAVILRDQGRHVIRATIDDFLFPRAQRYPRGEYSAEGCYFDTHDYDALNRVLLDPLGPGGDRRFQHAVYDRTADIVLSPPVATATADAVLVFDGVFLMRPELIDRWDLRIFVSTALEKTVARAVIRERRVSPRADVERRWRERYIPSQQLYFASARPTHHANIIVHNDEPQLPVWETQTH